MIPDSNYVLWSLTQPILFSFRESVRGATAVQCDSIPSTGIYPKEVCAGRHSTTGSLEVSSRAVSEALSESQHLAHRGRCRGQVYRAVMESTLMMSFIGRNNSQKPLGLHASPEF